MLTMKFNRFDPIIKVKSGKLSLANTRSKEVRRMVNEEVCQQEIADKLGISVSRVKQLAALNAPKRGV